MQDPRAPRQHERKGVRKALRSRGALWRGATNLWKAWPSTPILQWMLGAFKRALLTSVNCETTFWLMIRAFGHSGHDRILCGCSTGVRLESLCAEDSPGDDKVLSLGNWHDPWFFKQVQEVKQGTVCMRGEPLSTCMAAICCGIKSARHHGVFAPTFEEQLGCDLSQGCQRSCVCVRF